MEVEPEGVITWRKNCQSGKLRRKAAGHHSRPEGKSVVETHRPVKDGL